MPSKKSISGIAGSVSHPDDILFIVQLVAFPTISYYLINEGGDMWILYLGDALPDRIDDPSFGHGIESEVSSSD